MKQEMKKIYLSPIRDITIRSAELMKEGEDVVSFGAGDSDFDSPQPIKEAAIHAIQNNRSHYETIWGNNRLRELIRKQYYDNYEVEYQLDEVLITAAGTEAIFDTFLALIDPGDEVIVISPAFINYENCITMAGGKTVFVPVKQKNHFEPDIADVEAAITPATRMLVLNNPCNPTGVVYSKECMERLAMLAVKYDLMVFSDEVYDTILYDQVSCYSIAAFPGMKERTVVANSFSKSFAMTGWRIGYLLACGEMMEDIYKVHHYSTACQPTFIQDALADALTLPETRAWQNEMVKELEKRRNLVSEWLEEHPKLTSVVPQGAFYYFVNVSAYGMTGKEFALRLLEEKKVAVVPGEGLGKDFTDFIRLSYAVKEERLMEGLSRMDSFLKG